VTQERALAAIAGLLALLLAAGAAWARPLSEEENAALASAVSSFDAAMREGNHARVAETVPPKVLAAIARHAKTTPEAVIAQMIEATKALQSKTESFGMDLGTAIHKEHASGTPYVLIPTQTTMAIRGKRVRVISHTVALLDEGKWYLLSIGVLQLPILREVYPEFAGVEFPSGSTEMLNP
jgi:hypothetical protein